VTIRVVVLQRIEGSVELRATGMSATDPMVYVQVISANAGTEQIGNLPIGVLRALTPSHNR
jgi:hypothetical protein